MSGCPWCGASLSSSSDWMAAFDCGSDVWCDGHVRRSFPCYKRERKRLTARLAGRAATIRRNARKYRDGVSSNNEAYNAGHDAGYHEGFDDGCRKCEAADAAEGSDDA